MEMEPWMVEAAKEELRLLEAQHPDRFDYLKVELRSLIADAADASHPFLVPSSSSASTHASTSNKRKRKAKPDAGEGVGGSARRRSEGGSGGGCGEKSRADMAIERAEACLRMIQQVKESFFP